VKTTSGPTVPQRSLRSLLVPSGPLSWESGVKASLYVARNGLQTWTSPAAVRHAEWSQPASIWTMYGPRPELPAPVCDGAVSSWAVWWYALYQQRRGCISPCPKISFPR